MYTSYSDLYLVYAAHVRASVAVHGDGGRGISTGCSVNSAGGIIVGGNGVANTRTGSRASSVLSAASSSMKSDDAV